MDPLPTNILFIVNPKAGITIKSKILIRLLAGQYLDNRRFKPEIQFTQYKGHAKELARKAVEDGIPAVIAVGGDGTINEIAGVLADTGTRLGILPTGSGNGLAYHLKIPMSIIRAIRLINRGNERTIDTVRLNDQLFTSIAGIGFDATVASKFASSGVRGLISYMRIILQEYRRYQPGNYILEIDGKEYQRTAMMITFANSDQFGFRSRIVPHARIDDGYVDVCVVSKPSFLKLMFTAPRVFFGTFGKTSYAEYFRGKDIKVRDTKGHKVNIDGEAVILQEDLHIQINPLSLKVIVK